MWHVSFWLSAAHHISFLLYRFSVKYRFPFPILRLFTVKSPSVTQRSLSEENAFIKSNNPSPFFFRKIGSNNSYSNWKQFQVFKIATFEFNVTVYYGLWAKCTQLWPLNSGLLPIVMCNHRYLHFLNHDRNKRFNK